MRADELAQDVQALIDQYGGLLVLRAVEESEWGKRYREYELNRIREIGKQVREETKARDKAFMDEVIRIATDPLWNKK